MLTSTLEFKVQWKNTHAPEWSRRWCGEGTGTNIISLRLKSTNHSALENWQWNLRFNFFQLWTQEFSSKIYQRVQDSKTSTFGACYFIKPRPYRQNNGNKEPKKDWILTNNESEISVSLFSNNHNFLFGTTNSFYGFKRLVPSTGKNSGQKNSGAFCQAIWDLTQSPAIFSQSLFKFNTCVDINFRDQSAVKNHAPEWSLRWCRKKAGRKLIILRLKSTSHSALANRMEFVIQFFFQKTTRVYH